MAVVVPHIPIPRPGLTRNQIAETHTAVATRKFIVVHTQHGHHPEGNAAHGYHRTEGDPLGEECPGALLPDQPVQETMTEDLKTDFFPEVLIELRLLIKQRDEMRMVFIITGSGLKDQLLQQPAQIAGPSCDGAGCASLRHQLLKHIEEVDETDAFIRRRTFGGIQRQQVFPAIIKGHAPADAKSVQDALQSMMPADVTGIILLTPLETINDTCLADRIPDILCISDAKTCPDVGRLQQFEHFFCLHLFGIDSQQGLDGREHIVIGRYRLVGNAERHAVACVAEDRFDIRRVEIDVGDLYQDVTRRDPARRPIDQTHQVVVQGLHFTQRGEGTGQHQGSVFDVGRQDLFSVRPVAVMLDITLDLVQQSVAGRRGGLLGIV